MDGVLVKLSIVPFEDASTIQAGPPIGPPFIAQFNPESFTVNTEIELDSEPPPHGDIGREAKYKSIKPRTFSFDFLLDGTGASGPKLEVLLLIELFKLTVGFSGTTHRPRFLVLSWGTFLATCVVESYSIQYKLFRPNGTPLRAVLSATFREHIAREEQELRKNLESPDTIHAHTVGGEEHLALITHRVYQDPRWYVQVAETNDLNTLRHVDTGVTLLLPPLA